MTAARSWWVLAGVLASSGGVLGCGTRASTEQPVDVHVPGENEAGPDGSVVPEAAGPRQVDRDGHPLVTLLLVPGALADEYNAQATFEANVPRVLQDALEARLVALDTLASNDGGPDPVDWPIPDGGTHPLLPMFVRDVLLVDTALSCTLPDGGYASTYLDIDREVYLSGATHTTCGGRTPGDGVVDETLTLLVTGGRQPVTQGVSGPTKPAATTFPYLADPN